MPPSRHPKSGGCWVCKLRRKKCNESRPTCGDCAHLRIECQYGARPSWMDGGALQKQKAASLKEAIKQHAVHRREQAQTNNTANPDASNRQFRVIPDIMVTASSSSARSTTPVQPDDPASVERATTTPNQEPTLVDTLPWSYQQHQRSETLENASATEWNFIMKYIDHVFPATFPFYQPPIFDTGRSWLLHLLRKNKIAYHAALALSCYYFTMALSDAEMGSEHAVCKQMRWTEVEEETAKCFDSLRADVTALSLNGGSMKTTTMERAELMNSITQVIIFEIAMGKSTPWNTHLPAAMKLFEEIMATPEARLTYRGQPQSKFASVLLGISDPLWTNPWPCNHIWSPEQTGFRFCAGYLIFIDIIASTILGSMPRLGRYHADVLAKIDDGEPVVGEAEIRLSAIVGCRNSVAELIAIVSTNVSSTEKRLLPDNIRVTRAPGVERHVLKDIGVLHETITANPTPDLHYDRGYLYRPPKMNHHAPISSIRALIWSHATMLYHYTASWPWRHSDLEIIRHVGHIVDLLATVPKDQLRTLAWPILIAGCLANQEHEASFTALLVSLSRVQAIGPLDDARRLIPCAWQIRPTYGYDGREPAFASLLASLGTPVLIV
jgi:hypothetical protein